MAEAVVVKKVETPEELGALLRELRGRLSPEEVRIVEEERYEVATAMRQHGGSFVRGLGVALTAADVPNALRIKTAFPGLWQKYLAIFRQGEEAQMLEQMKEEQREDSANGA